MVLIMSIKKSTNRKTFHLRMTTHEQRKVATLGKHWGLKSWNAVVIEALDECLKRIKAASSDAPAVSMQNEDK